MNTVANVGCYRISRNADLLGRSPKLPGYRSGCSGVIARWIGQHDNNVAEYAALPEALQYAVKLKASALHVFSDSEVVVRQMNRLDALASRLERRG